MNFVVKITKTNAFNIIYQLILTVISIVCLLLNINYNWNVLYFVNLNFSLNFAIISLFHSRVPFNPPNYEYVCWDSDNSINCICTVGHNFQNTFIFLKCLMYIFELKHPLRCNAIKSDDDKTYFNYLCFCDFENYSVWQNCSMLFKLYMHIPKKHYWIVKVLMRQEQTTPFELYQIV